MILTLTLNPAIDVELTTDRIIYDDRSYIESESFQPGGKGVNQAITLQGYGAEVEAIAPCGGPMGERFANLIRAKGVNATLIPVAGDLRRNLAITDQNGLTLKLDQRGPTFTAEEVSRIEEAVLRRLPQASWLTLMGSAPNGVPTDFYARLVSRASELGVCTLLDSSGDPVRAAMAAHPTITKPNRPEAERLLGRGLLSEFDFLKAAEELHAMGPENLILSLGAQGAVAVTTEGRWRATTEPVSGGSPIGAGDVLGATTIFALDQGDSFQDAFRLGVAAGMVAASRPGLGSGSLEDVRAVLGDVKIREF